MRSTNPTTVRRRAATGTSIRSTSGWIATSLVGRREKARFSLVSGYSSARLAERVARAAPACSTVTSGFNRPLMKRFRLLLLWRRSPESPWITLSIIMGTQKSGTRPRIIPLNPSGAIPTTVYGRELIRTDFPKISGSAPRARSQYPWLRTVTKWVPGVLSSSGRKPRPMVGSTPRRSK
jgi:hypothetical protein